MPMQITALAIVVRNSMSGIEFYFSSDGEHGQACTANLGYLKKFVSLHT
jgi:hypothetical protein